MKKICVAGLNPAWQKTLMFRHFERGGINRASEVDLEPAGKGINFARGVSLWGTAEAVVYQFLGGETGKNIRRAMWDEHLANVSVEVPGRTRTCVTALSSDDCVMTELVEPAFPVPPAGAGELLEMFLAGLKDADAAALCGTCPPGINEYFSGKVAQAAREAGKPVLADSVSMILPALEEGVDVVKINRSELAELTGEAELEMAFQFAFANWKIRYLAMTDGPGNACFSEGGTITRLSVPEIKRPVNPIGSGDICSGVMLSCMLNGETPLEAFRNGLAAASANCLTEGPAVFEKSIALELLAQIRIL